MTEFEALITSVVSLCALIYLMFWCYRDYKVDRFRQNIFQLRDQLFDSAKNGDLSFDDDAYQMLRSTMNGAIRFAHRLNLAQVLLFILLVRNDRNTANVSFRKALKDNIACLSHDQQKLVLKYHLQMNRLVIEHLIYSSPVLLLTFIFPLAYFLRAKKHIQKAFKQPLDKIDSMAYAAGYPK